MRKVLGVSLSFFVAVWCWGQTTPASPTPDASLPLRPTAKWSGITARVLPERSPPLMVILSL